MRVVRTLLTGLVTAALTVLGGTLIVFLVTFYGTGEEQKAQLNINVEAGPVAEYVQWWSDFLGGDFGGKFQSTNQLQREIITGMQFTSLLVSIAVIVCFLGALGVALAVLSNRGSPFARVFEAMVFFSGNVPIFVVAYILYDLLMETSVMTPFPGSSLVDHLPQLFVAGVVLGFGSGVLGELARVFRFELEKLLGEPYILSARARYAPVWLHVMRASIVPLSSALLAKIPYLIGAGVIVERIFNIYGIGAVMLEAGRRGNFAQLMSCAVLLMLVVVAARIINQLIVTTADPRVRHA